MYIGRELKKEYLYKENTWSRVHKSSLTQKWRFRQLIGRRNKQSRNRSKQRNKKTSKKFRIKTKRKLKKSKNPNLRDCKKA